MAPVVTLSPPGATIFAGGAIELGVRVMSAQGEPVTGVSLLWSSSNPAVATVGGDGIVRGVGAGTAQVQVTANGTTAAATITVALAPLTRRVLDPVPEPLRIGDRETLVATVFDATGQVRHEVPVQWRVIEGADIVRVDEAGVLEALARGDALVNAQAGPLQVDVALPDLTAATDASGTWSVTPTNGTGMVLSSTSTARPYVYFVPDWTGLGINTTGPEGYAVEVQISSPVQASSSFFTFFFGSAANPNGSGSGSGGRCLNTAGTRNVIARSVSAGTAELGATIASQASDFAALSFFAAALPGEVIGSGLGSALPAGPGSYTAYRDGYARSLSTAWGLSPGNVALLFGGANISGNLPRIRIWKRGVS
jgi:hypothetical protein